MKVKIIETKDSKILKSESYNFTFNKKTGMFARWGKTQDDDPIMGMPEIADIEITTSCSGPDGVPCKFCSPAGTKVNTPNGDIDIEKLSVGDVVYAWDGNKIVENTIVELYRHDYNMELIKIELSDGSSVELTPEHEVFLVDGTQKPASELVEGDDVRTYSQI